MQNRTPWTTRRRALGGVPLCMLVLIAFATVAGCAFEATDESEDEAGEDDATVDVAPPPKAPAGCFLVTKSDGSPLGYMCGQPMYE